MEVFHIGKIITAKLKDEQRTVAWLARQVDCDRGNLGRQLRKTHIYPELLQKISKALKTDFFACYSQHLSSQAM